MNGEPISFDTICRVGYCGLLLCVFVVPAWLIIFPPRPVRSWRLVYHLLFAIISAQAAVYALFYGFVYPASDAVARAHPGALLCGILCARPSYTWLPIILVSAICFAVRADYIRVNAADT